MPISSGLRAQLVDAVCKIPAAETVAGRSALLAGLPIPVVSNFRDSNIHTDITSIVWLLGECYGPRREWWLLQFIDNAKAAVSGTDLERTLIKIRGNLVDEERASFANLAEIAQVHLFDLHHSVLLCVAQLPKDGGLSGFVIPGATQTIVENFCQSLPYRGEKLVRVWTRDQVAQFPPLRVGPYHNCVQVSDAIGRINRLRGLLESKHVTWAAYVEVEDDAEAIWKAAKAKFAQCSKKHLILILGMPPDRKPPTEMRVLESPTFQPEDVTIWVNDIARLKSWSDSFARRWIKVIVAESLSGESLSPDLLYATLVHLQRLVFGDNVQELEKALDDYEQFGGA